MLVPIDSFDISQTIQHIHLLNINPLRTKLYLSHLKTQFVRRSKHSASVIKTDKLILYRKKKSLFVMRFTQNI